MAKEVLTNEVDQEVEVAPVIPTEENEQIDAPASETESVVTDTPESKPKPKRAPRKTVEKEAVVIEEQEKTEEVEEIFSSEIEEETVEEDKEESKKKSKKMFRVGNIRRL